MMIDLTPYANKNRALHAFNPFRDMEELEKSFFGDSLNGRGMNMFRTDIKDIGNAYLLEADLPGFRKEDIHVDLEGDTLTITAERHSEVENEEKKGQYLRCERTYGSYSRSFDTVGIQTDAITASYENGVLKLAMPKIVEQQPATRRLEIK